MAVVLIHNGQWYLTGNRFNALSWMSEIASPVIIYSILQSSLLIELTLLHRQTLFDCVSHCRGVVMGLLFTVKVHVWQCVKHLVGLINTINDHNSIPMLMLIQNIYNTPMICPWLIKGSQSHDTLSEFVFKYQPYLSNNTQPVKHHETLYYYQFTEHSWKSMHPPISFP